MTPIDPRDVHHVILAGGSGTRFWPVSRREVPKQFLPLAGEVPLLRQAWDRSLGMVGAERVWVSAGNAHRERIAALLPGLVPDRFVAEPCARNTAPAVGLAALRVARVAPGAVIVTMPSDHVYRDTPALSGALDAAVTAAGAAGRLATLGIRPSRAETGYGWIEAGPAPAGAPFLPAVRFVEKPDRSTAHRFLDHGSFLWNSGVFVWRCDAILAAIREFVPALAAGLARIEESLGTPREGEVLESVFHAQEPVSIDYAVMEKARDVVVVPVDPGWDDVGSWDAVAGFRPGGVGGALVVNEGSRDCFVWTGDDPDRVVALVGVEDLIVVQTGNTLLICRKGASQAVRGIVTRLEESGRDDVL